MSTIHNQAKARREEKSYQVYHILLRVKYTLQVGTNLETKYRKKETEIWTFIYLRIHLRLLTISEAKKRVYEVLFIDMQKYIYSDNVFNTLSIDIKQKS